MMDNIKELANLIFNFEHIVYDDLQRCDSDVLVDVSQLSKVIGYLRSQFSYLYDCDFDFYAKSNGLDTASKVHPDGDTSILVMLEDSSSRRFFNDLSRKHLLKQKFKESVDLEEAKRLARVIRESHDYSECQDEISEFLDLVGLESTEEFEESLEWVADMLDLELYCSWSGALYNTPENRDEFRQFMEDPENFEKCDRCPQHLLDPYGYKCSKCLVEQY